MQLLRKCSWGTNSGSSGSGGHLCISRVTFAVCPDLTRLRLVQGAGSRTEGQANSTESKCSVLRSGQSLLSVFCPVSASAFRLVYHTTEQKTLVEDLGSLSVVLCSFTGRSPNKNVYTISLAFRAVKISSALITRQREAILFKVQLYSLAKRHSIQF